jgi:hypothetical protein
VKSKYRNLTGAMNEIPQQLPPKKKPYMLLKFQQEISLFLQNVTGSIIVQENVADYSQDNLIEIYHDVSSQVV